MDVSGLKIDPQIQFALVSFFTALWLHAAWTKLHNPARFSGTLAAYALLPAGGAFSMTIVLGISELATAIGLWFTLTRALAVGMGLALLLVYAGAVGINLLRGRTHIDCGCNGFGQGQPIRWGMLLRHTLLALCLSALLLPHTERVLTLLDAALACLAVLALLLLYLTVDVLARPAPNSLLKVT